MTPSTKTLCRSVTVLAGLAGFIGLLVAGHYLPAWSGPLRAGALAGFLGFVRSTLHCCSSVGSWARRPRTSKMSQQKRQASFAATWKRKLPIHRSWFDDHVLTRQGCGQARSHPTILLNRSSGG